MVAVHNIFRSSKIKIYCAYRTKEQTAQDWVNGLEFFKKAIIDSAYFLSVSYMSDNPTPKDRAMIVEESKNVNTAVMKGHAIVFRNKLQVATVSAINLFIKKKYPEKIFLNPLAALIWLYKLAGIEPKQNIIFDTYRILIEDVPLKDRWIV